MIPKPVKQVGAGVAGLLFFVVVAQVIDRVRVNDPDHVARQRRDRDSIAAEIRTRQRASRARLECKEAITRQLKSPKSANFENTETGPLVRDTTRFIVRGEVTAVNAFNAPLTNRYACEFDLTGRILSAEIRER